MTNEEQKLREFADKWGYSLEGWIDPLTGHPGKILQPNPDGCLSDLTALISENYVSKEEHDKVLQQRDELREALINVMVILKDCYPLLFDNEKPAVKQAEVAIKNTDG